MTQRLPLRESGRPGFTLLELLVALVLLAIVGTAVMNVLTRTQRVSTAQTEQTQVQSNVRAGMMVLASELREVGYDVSGGVVNSDLISLGADFIRFRAARGLGITCHLEASSASAPGYNLWLRKPLFSFRPLRTTDGLQLFVEHDNNHHGDDEWTSRSIQAIDESASCPDGTAAVKVTVASAAPLPLSTHISVGSPVRIFEVVQFGLYASDGRSWLGARSISAGEASYQPVVGPLRAGDGLRLTYYNKSNLVVDPANVAAYSTIRSVAVTLRGESERASHGMDGSGQADIGNLVLTSRIALRNNLRP